MSSPDEVDLDPQEQAILREWRLLVENHYLDDIKRLEGNPQIIHGFEIEHTLIEEYPTLKVEFHENPTRTMKLGNRVMREQFEAAMARMRPILRVTRLAPNYLRRVNDLRMRDRNKVVSLDVRINEVSGSYGWVQMAVYECLDCHELEYVEQRRARERKSPRHCNTCFGKWVGKMESEDEDALPFPPRPNFQMITEHSNYEDVQDISMSQVVYNDQNKVLHRSEKEDIIGTVSDDLVGELEPNQFARINGIVRVQPVPNRTFSRDTRRVLSIDVLSVELLDLKE